MILPAKGPDERGVRLGTAAAGPTAGGATEEEPAGPSDSGGDATLVGVVAGSDGTAAVDGTRARADGLVEP